MSPELLEKTIDSMFSTEWTGFACILEEVGMTVTQEECRRVFDLLPDRIKIEFVCHGLGDTPTNDDAYVYLRDNNLLREKA